MFQFTFILAGRQNGCLQLLKAARRCWNLRALIDWQ